MLLLAKNSTLPKLIRNGRLFLGGALLGVLVFVLVFGVSTLDVTNDAFCRGGYIEKDIQQHYAGWLFYRQSSAGWPLCIARGINYPDGLSVAYTDSIPLVAALLKPVANLVGGTFQYMGWFTLVCFALQGGFGALLAGLFLPGCAAPLAADLLFVTSPVLFERVFRHTSLGAQFFVLAALYFYFAARRKGQYASRGLFVLNVLAVGIHPYFLPMTYAITLALLLEYALHNRQLAGPGLYLAANFGGTALLGWALGLLYGSASSGGQALYGYFCMNLNALWNPVGVNGVLYSRVLPAQNQVYGNYDAFAYLGLGVLIALPIAVVLLRRHAAPPLGIGLLLRGFNGVCHQQCDYRKRRNACHAAATRFADQTFFHLPFQWAVVLANLLSADAANPCGPCPAERPLADGGCCPAGCGTGLGCKPRHGAAQCGNAAGHADRCVPHRDGERFLAGSAAVYGGCLNG